MKKAVPLVFLMVISLLSGVALFGETIDLLCFNTWNGLKQGGFLSVPSLEEPGNRDFRRELLERGIGSFKPDIVGLLELNPLPSAARDLEEEFSFTSVSQIDRGGVRIGNVGLPVNLRSGMGIFAAEGISLDNRGVRKLSGGLLGNWFQVGNAGLVLSATAEIAGRTVHLFITHWQESLYEDSDDLKMLVDEYADDEMAVKELTGRIRSAAEGEELRLQQAAAALDYINQVAGKEPAVLMGTLAAAPDSEVLALIKKAGFRDTWTSGGGATWDEVRNPNTALSDEDLYSAGKKADRVDYVLIRGDGIKNLGSRLVFNDPTYGTYPSDHYGLLVRLEIDAAE